MKNLKITNKISQGMYVLTTNNGGCIVDSVSQISSGENPLIAVSVMKKNNTNSLLKSNKKFAISVLGREADGEIIKTFGFNSMREINKFDRVDTRQIEGLEVINGSLGYMICEIIDYIDIISMDIKLFSSIAYLLSFLCILLPETCNVLLP